MEKMGILLENIEDSLGKNRVHIFDENGGVIGSDPECSFSVQDLKKQIKDKHVQIKFEEGFFTICPIDDSVIFYNESFSKLQSGFDVIINKGDTFKIGDLKFRFADISDIDNEAIEAKLKIEDIPRHNELEIAIEPRFKVNIDLNDNIKENIKAKNNLDFVKDKEQKSDTLQIQDSKLFGYQDLLELIRQNFKELKQNQKKINFDQNSSLERKQIEEIIENIPLIKSTKLINIIVLTLISKELYNPLFDGMKNDLFMRCLNSAIKDSINNDKELFEILSLMALEAYKDKS
ncbi:FHA domain-containing protein [Campylobacter novaezeelandiae]|uniref:FHA domain-containing protein n=2 Tax=Campylobacter novaezeelandiae TaxID=2267891 RepID=A0A4Q9JUV7_9BACT|nr:FHA domain-containing protein [Campylobacter novaezeelandiae]MBK1963366.1 FHA domain-containing protein [Campylobacter novaezeelandiae]TBR78851.1 FHA domain-containing protein [Campylobacter novaezeelandiae]TBR81717.1 FHA domain-containing protein [Campylobacter novaezeelandiae]TBR82190.1 FHA domain-containing protein [Campylobacter novaezeelandiae]